MAEYLIQGEALDEIADAINAKTGGSDSMTPAEMVEAIEGIETGGGVNIAQLVPGVYNTLTVDQYGRITGQTARINIIPLTKPIPVSNGDVLRFAIWNTVRAYHQWTLYENGVQKQYTQTANYNSPYTAYITINFDGFIDSIGFGTNPSGTVDNLKFIFQRDGIPILI